MLSLVDDRREEQEKLEQYKREKREQLEQHKRNVQQLMRSFNLLNVKQQKAEFADLPDDVIVRVLSHCESAQMTVASIINRRMHTLVTEQQKSDLRILYRQDYGEWEQLYPKSRDSWTLAWSEGATRKSFFDLLQVKSDNTLMYFDHVQTHFADFMKSPDTEQLVAHKSEIEFNSESEIHRKPSDSSLQNRLHDDSYRIPYQLFFICSGWRKWIGRAVRLVQSLNDGVVYLKAKEARVQRFLENAPLMALLIIRFLSLNSERMHALAAGSVPFVRGVVGYVPWMFPVEVLARGCAAKAFENWALLCGRTLVASADQRHELYLRAALIAADDRRTVTERSSHVTQKQASIRGNNGGILKFYIASAVSAECCERDFFGD